MKLTREHKRLLFIDFGLAPFVVNALLNAGFGWGATRVVSEIPLFGLVSVSLDMVGMAFGVTFGTGLVVTGQARRMLAQRALGVPPVPTAMGEAMDKWPRTTFIRSVNLGVLSVPLFAPLPILTLMLLGVESLSAESFILLKGVWGGVQGALVTPLIALSAWITPRPQ